MAVLLGVGVGLPVSLPDPMSLPIRAAEGVGLAGGAGVAGSGELTDVVDVSGIFDDTSCRLDAQSDGDSGASTVAPSRRSTPPAHNNAYTHRHATVTIQHRHRTGARGGVFVKLKAVPILFPIFYPYFIHILTIFYGKNFIKFLGMQAEISSFQLSSARELNLARAEVSSARFSSKIFVFRLKF
jgi:hypothetical protein